MTPPCRQVRSPFRTWTAPCVVARMLRLSSRTGGKNVQVDTAYVPYLTRPGQVRYRLVSGRSRNYEHTMEGPVLLPVRHPGVSVTSGRFTVAVSLPGITTPGLWGWAGTWSEFGTVSADVTQSVARIPGEETKQGKSRRLELFQTF